MGSPDVNKAYLVTGKLAYGCNNLGAAFPHGGTALGVVTQIEVRAPERYFRSTREETNTTGVVQWLGGDVILGARLAAWDNEALAKVFPNTDVGSAGNTVIKWPGTDLAAGQKLSGTLCAPLVFSAINSAHPSVILYNAAPLVDAAAELMLSAYRFLEVPVLFLGLEDNSTPARVGAMGRLAELSL